jgi:DNA (cytosine-5)-methyltransferase 1
MLTEFARVVTEAQPVWWLMENVPQVPDVHIPGYVVQRFNVWAWEFGLKQRRNRCFQFGSRDGIELVLLRLKPSHFGRWAETITTKHGHRNFSDLCELQGLPRNFYLPGLSRTAQIRCVANGVPVPMARGVAEAIRDRRVTHFRLCLCGCGRILRGPARQQSATAACRKRIERERRHSHDSRTRLLSEPVRFPANPLERERRHSHDSRTRLLSDPVRFPANPPGFPALSG